MSRGQTQTDTDGSYGTGLSRWRMAIAGQRRNVNPKESKESYLCLSVAVRGSFPSFAYAACTRAAGESETSETAGLRI
jgi:hypothetical protein